MNTAKRLIPLVGASIALMVLFRILVPGFLHPENLVDLVQQISVNAIIAFGMTFCILIGGIDLSVGAVLAVVGTTAVYVLGHGDAESQSLLRFMMAVGAGLSVAVLFGAFNGFCAARTKMPPFIITLATMMVARGAALRFNQGRPMSIPSHETWFLGLGNGRIAGVLPVPVLIMLVILVISAVLLHRTRFGQHLYGIGGNREAARFTVLFVSSLASMFPMPLKATYAASKRFLYDFALALREELKPENVSVMVLCPGGLATTNEAMSGIAAQGFWGSATTNKLEAIARKVVDRALKGKAVYIPGIINNALVFLGRIVPRSLVTAIVFSRFSGAQKKWLDTGDGEAEIKHA